MTWVKCRPTSATRSSFLAIPIWSAAKKQTGPANRRKRGTGVAIAIPNFWGRFGKGKFLGKTTPTERRSAASENPRSAWRREIASGLPSGKSISRIRYRGFMWGVSVYPGRRRLHPRSNHRLGGPCPTSTTVNRSVPLPSVTHCYTIGMLRRKGSEPKRGKRKRLPLFSVISRPNDYSLTRAMLSSGSSTPSAARALRTR